MKFGSSLRNRQVIARLDKGEDFIETLKSFFVRERARSCVFSGNGFFSKCHLQTLDPDQHQMKTIFASDSFVMVPNIIGNITMMGTEPIVNASCVLVYRMFEQLHTVGGLIQDAKVYSVELHLTICDDLRLMRALDPITGLVPINKIQSAYDEDYGSGILLNSESSMNLASDFGASHAGESDFPAISSIPTHTPAPEVVHRKSAIPATAESSSSVLSLDNTSSSSGFENLNTGIPSVKRRRRTSSQSGAIAVDSEKSEKQDAAPQPNAEDAAENASIPTKRQRKPSTFASTPIQDLKVGDWIIHPTLGKCFIQTILPNNCLQIHTEVGTDHDISMGYFHAVKMDDINGVRCYRLERR